MLDYLSVIPLLTSDIQKLVLFGDKHQIGVLDTFLSGGERDLLPITKFTPKGNKIKMMKTYRYGGQLGLAVQQLIPKIVYDDIQTAFLHVIKPWNADLYRELSKKVDIVLTHYGLT